VKADRIGVELWHGSRFSTTSEFGNKGGELKDSYYRV